MISKEEKDAIKRVLKVGEKHGFGNLIAHLRTAWAASLIASTENNVNVTPWTWEQANQATITAPYSIEQQNRILSDETP